MKKIGIIIGFVAVAFSVALFANNKKRDLASSEPAVTTAVAPLKTPTVHAFHQGESLWFIANVYYGKGTEFTKIVEANHLASTEGLMEGQKLIIPSPKWDPNAADFKKRYQTLWDHRAQRLAAKKENKKTVVTADKAEKVVAKAGTVEAKNEEQKTEKKVEKVAPHSQRTRQQAAAAVKAESSDTLVVPIPSSPIFRATSGSNEAAGTPSQGRTASEGTGQ